MSAAMDLAFFSPAVLNAYRRRDDCMLLRTNTSARLETPRWSLRFRLRAGDTLELSERELWKLEPAEAAHWYSFRLGDGAQGRHWLAPADPVDTLERPWD
jgi:hypothetical protein